MYLSNDSIVRVTRVLVGQYLEFNSSFGKTSFMFMRIHICVKNTEVNFQLEMHFCLFFCLIVIE